MRLGELVQGVDALKTSADLAVEVTSLAYDSRRGEELGFLGRIACIDASVI